jgi:hypothetical protein
MPWKGGIIPGAGGAILGGLAPSCGGGTPRSRCCGRGGGGGPRGGGGEGMLVDMWSSCGDATHGVEDEGDGVFVKLGLSKFMPFCRSALRIP